MLAPLVTLVELDEGSSIYEARCSARTRAEDEIGHVREQWEETIGTLAVLPVRGDRVAVFEHIVGERFVGSRKIVVFRIALLVDADGALLTVVLTLGYAHKLILGVDGGALVGGDDSGVVCRVTAEVELSVGNVGVRWDSPCVGAVAEGVRFRRSQVFDVNTGGRR